MDRNYVSKGQSQPAPMVPSAPTRRIPPPPPPPPPRLPQESPLNRRDIILGFSVVAATAIGVTKGFSSTKIRKEDERQLAYVASQLGVPGTPSLVSAVVDKSDGSVVAIKAFGESGKLYIATVDPNDRSQMLLASDEGKTVYVLPTRYEEINLANRKQIESIFRVAHWENSMERIR